MTLDKNIKDKLNSMQQSQDQERERLLDEAILEHTVDLTKEIKEDPILLYQGDIPLLRANNFSCVVGQAKSRKTFLISAICGGFLKKGDTVLGFNTESNQDGRILYFDTEQSLGDTMRAFKRVARMSNLPYSNNRFYGIELRSCKNSKERFDIVKRAIETHKPTLVIIDGLTDLMINPNDMTEAGDLCSYLLNTTARLTCHIVTVIHLNEGLNATKARGHIGSEAMRKAETVFLLKKDGENTKVSFPQTRGYPPEEFTYFINQDGLPMLTTVEKATKKVSDDELITLFSNVFRGVNYLRYGELNKLLEDIGKMGNRTARRRISTALAKDIIGKTPDNQYYFNQTLKNEIEEFNKVVENLEIPF